MKYSEINIFVVITLQGYATKSWIQEISDDQTVDKHSITVCILGY